ncbi:MAG: universal stress protein [Propionivibrio sp.]
MSTPRETTMPQPSRIDRDADGRLIGLSLDGGARALPGEMQWLIAVDGSDHSLRAVAEAARLAGRFKDRTLHLVNVQRWLSREAAESELGSRGWKVTEKARALLNAAELPWQLHIVMGEAAESIVALSTHLGCQTIVIGSRGMGATENLLVGSVAYKVIHLSPVSVLVVR